MIGRVREIANEAIMGGNGEGYRGGGYEVVGGGGMRPGTLAETDSAETFSDAFEAGISPGRGARQVGTVTLVFCLAQPKH